MTEVKDRCVVDAGTEGEETEDEDAHAFKRATLARRHPPEPGMDVTEEFADSVVHGSLQGNVQF